MPWLRLIANTEADRAKPKALTVIPHRDVVDNDNVEEEADDHVADKVCKHFSASYEEKCSSVVANVVAPKVEAKVKQVNCDQIR